MKINFEKRKTTETVGNILQKTTEISKKVSVGVQSQAKNIVDKSKSDSYLRK